MKTKNVGHFNLSFILAFLILTLQITVSCSNDKYKKGTDRAAVSEFSPSASFVINNAEENMPVWVNGHKDSKAIILVIHGGPGSDVLDFRTYMDGVAFKKIEENFLVAYWQQRAAGQSKGTDNLKYYTINQYVNDADKVVDKLRKDYPNKKIIILAHSWGGMLSSSYLIDSKRRNKIAGWIYAAGVHNGTTLNKITISAINEEADSRIARGEDIESWEEIKNVVKENPNLANQVAYKILDFIPEVPIKVDNSDFKISDRAISSNSVLFKEIVKVDNNPYLGNVKIPCLVLWGKYDFAVSKEYKNEFLKNIGSKNVTNINFEASGHYMMFHEPNLFAESVGNFIKSLD